MHESILHNDLLASFPEPSIDADTAWKSMNDLLDHEMREENPKHKQSGNDQWSWMADMLLIAIALFMLNNPVIKERNLSVEVNNKTIEHVTYHNHDNNDIPLRAAKTSTTSSFNNTISSTHMYDTMTNTLSISKDNTKKNIDFNKNILGNNQPLIKPGNKRATIPGKSLKQLNNHFLPKSKQYHSSGIRSVNKEINKVDTKLLSHYAPITSEVLVTTLERTTSVSGIQLADLLQHPSNIAPLQDAPLISSGFIPGRRRKALPFSFGLQWQIPVPLQGIEHFSTGINGQQAPYQYLLPGVWFELPVSRNGSILLEAAYGQPLLTGRKSLSDTSGIHLPNDTSLGRRSTSLLKLKGFDIQLSYKQYLTSHWSISAGISYQYLSKALLEDRYTRIHDNKIISDSLYSISTNSNSHLHHSVINLSSEATYHKNRWTIGTQIRLPLYPVYKDDTHSIKPVQASLIIRWAIK